MKLHPASLQARPITQSELNATLVLSLVLDEVSAKVRTGPPIDEAKDMELPIWAGVLNMRSFVPGDGTADPQLKPGIEQPAYVTNYRRPADIPAGEQ